MLKKIEKIAKALLMLSLTGLYLGQLLPDARALTVSATVSSTMVSCTTPLSASQFGTIDNSAIYTATSSTTTISSSGSVYLKAYGVGSGSGDNPGLWSTANSKLVGSVTSTATTTLVAGAEGYGLAATTSDATLSINERYWHSSSTGIVGGIASSSAGQYTVASSGSAVSSEVVRVDYEAAVAVTTQGGTDYQDTITFSCTAS